MSRQNPSQRGFTMIEVLIAITITAGVMTMVSTTFIATLMARNEVASLTESTEAGSRIISLLERDLRGLWTHNIKDNRILIGRNRDIAGPAADRIDFLCSTQSIGKVPDTSEQLKHVPICEVGYWLRSNPKYPSMMQLWRREDPMVDKDLIRGGTFQLVHDRMRSFNITYFKSLGANAEEFHDWDSSTEDSLPRVIKIEFQIERKLPNTNQINQEIEDFEELTKNYVHYVVLDKVYMDILKPDVALMPVFPPKPEAAEGGNSGGPGGPAGPAGPAGPGGPGAKTQTVVQGRGSSQIRDSQGRTSITQTGPRGNSGSRPPSLPPNFFPTGNRGNSGNINLNDLFKQLGNR